MEFDERAGNTWFSCAMLNIHLNNSLILWVSLKPKSNDPRFFHLQNAPEYIAPQTDGERVYWTDGASLHMDEIMELLVG